MAPFQENIAANSAGCVRFLWADSSPDRFHDWLWAEQHHIAGVESLLRCFEASQTVTSWLRAPDVDPLDIPQQCQDALNTLICGVQHHVHCPVALGGGKKMADIAQKAAALAHTFSLENPDWSQLLRYLQSFISITTDFGTEAGLSSFRVALQGLFPSWHDLDPMEVDGEVPDIDGRANLPRPDVLLDRFFLENALPVLGLQHVVFNLLREVESALPFWHAFFRELKNFEALLNWKFRSQRFVATCLRNTPFADSQHRFENFNQSLYEARWHEVAKFVAKVLPVLGILRATFDAQRFQRADGVQVDAGEGGAGAGAAPAAAADFNPEALARSLQSPMFSARLILVSKLQAFPEDLAGWAEDCPCHSKVCAGLGQYRRSKLLKAHYGGVPVCPMAGKRAPELAAGHVLEVFQGLAQQTLTDVLSESPLPLDPEMQRDLVRDFGLARNHMQVVLLSKLDHWMRLPWKLCGLAHAEEAVARRVAGEVKDRLQQCPEAELRHRLTLKFLSGPLHDELIRFADGVAYADLSMEFRTAVAPLRFIPVTETIIESKHAVTGRLHRRDTHAGPVMVSLYNRMVILERRFARETSPGSNLFMKIAKQLTLARRLGSVPSRLGLQRHPLLVECEDKHGQAAVRAYLQKPLTKVIYRTDIESQYIELDAVRQTHTQLQERSRRAMQAALGDEPQLQPVSYEGLKKAMVLEHFRSVGKPLPNSHPTLFSMPASSNLSLQSVGAFFEGSGRAQDRQTNVDCALEQGDEEDPSQAASQHFFSIVKAKPSQNKRMFVHPGAGRSLASHHVAVAVHSAAPSDVPGDVLVLQEQTRLAQKSDNLAILTSLGASLNEIEEGLQCWSVRPELSYMLPGRSEPVNEMLTKMVHEGYAVEKGEYHVPPRHLEQDAENLCEQGLLSSNEMRGYALTKRGMQALSLRWHATSPRPACCIRDLDIMEMSVYELTSKLEQAGFEWRRWPSSQKARREIVAYIPGNEKIFYATMALPVNAYLIALLRAEEIIAAGPVYGSG